MTGLSERPSRQPREKRKASNATEHAGEHSSIRMLYAAKIAAAWLYLRKEEREAAIAALLSERHAALQAVRRESGGSASRRLLTSWWIAARGLPGRARQNVPTVASSPVRRLSARERIAVRVQRRFDR
jgi:hypothetical protein